MAETNDLALYGRWREGKDREAFDELVTRHAPMVYSTCRRILNAPQEAEETAIEAFQILAHAPNGPQTHVGAWLHAAATARAQQRTRTQRPRPQSATKEPGDSQITWETLQTEIDPALTAVPWQSRIPLIGQYVEDKTQAEIAEEMELDRQRVIADAVTGMEYLRKELASRGMALSESRLKELLATHMVEPVPATLAPRLAERAVADPLAGRRLASGFQVDETIKKASSGIWVLPLAAVVVIAAVVLWVARDGEPDVPDTPAETATAETTEPAPASPPESPGPRTPRPAVGSRETRRPEASSAQPMAQPETRTVSYHGIVRDTAGNPVPQARVFTSALPADPANAEGALETGPLGGFDLNDIPATTRQITVWHEAYKPATFSITDATVSPIEIALTAAARVTGIVTYIGAPVPEQSIELVDAAGKTLRTQTGQDGTYTFLDADPGMVQIRANLAPMEPANRRRTMYSTALLEAGLTTQADFTFGALDAAIEGTATFNQEAARGAKIVARIQTPSGGEEHFDTAVQADTTFLFEAVPAGPTILQLQGLRVGRTEHLRSISVQTRSGQSTPCDFVLEGSATVIIQVTGMAPGATGIVAAIEPGTSLLDYDWPDFNLTPVNLLARITLTQDGEYTLEGLEGGGCTICAYAKPPVAPAAVETQTGEEPHLPLYDAAGITVQPGGETVIVLQLQ